MLEPQCRILDFLYYNLLYNEVFYQKICPNTCTSCTCSLEIIRQNPNLSVREENMLYIFILL